MFYSKITNIFNLHVIIPLVLAMATNIQLRMYTNAASPKRKSWLLGGLAICWFFTVLGLAWWFCGFTTTIEQCFWAWTVAFTLGCLIALFEVFLVRVGKPKHNLTEQDKMKLRDI